MVYRIQTILRSIYCKQYNGLKFIQQVWTSSSQQSGRNREKPKIIYKMDHSQRKELNQHINVSDSEGVFFVTCLATEVKNFAQFHTLSQRYFSCKSILVCLHIYRSLDAFYELKCHLERSWRKKSEVGVEGGGRRVRKNAFICAGGRRKKRSPSRDADLILN